MSRRGMNVHTEEDKDMWIGIQKKTFTRWANTYLPDDSKIQDLVADLATGVTLSKVLQKISGETVGKINKTPKMKIHELENVNQCLDFIRKHEIQLVNIGSNDIVGGNEKIILGLLWTIILRFEVAGADGKAGLLLWLQRSTSGYNGVEVKDFTSSWKDGLAFNALIHRYRPDLLEFNELSSGDALGNCEKAFAIAEESLNIPRLLDPEDVVNHPDEKSQVAYLSQFFKLFVGQTKLEKKLRALKNAVEVTQRHDEWIAQYEAGSQEVLAFSEDSNRRLGEPMSLQTTAEVKAALDAFSKYMKETKPVMAAKRAETEGIFSALSRSKRNNNRPEFVPTVPVEKMNAVWEDLEKKEQEYERKMLDTVLAYQSADHAVAKFSTKASTVSSWIDEKTAVFEAGETGSSVPDIEAHLEVHHTFEVRAGLYEKVILDLEGIVAKTANVTMHAGAVQIASELESLKSRMTKVQADGAAHKAKLESALSTERDLVEKEKQYLHLVEDVVFTIDKLEEMAHEEDVGATAAELMDAKNSAGSFSAKVEEASQKVNSLSELADQITSKRPEAPEHCRAQKDRLSTVSADMASRITRVSEALLAEENTEKLCQKFAGAANSFGDFCVAKRAELAGISGSLESQNEACGSLRESVVGASGSGASQMDQVTTFWEECENAKVVANPYTPHTVYSLKAQYEQLLKAINRTEDAIKAQMLAQQSLEITPDQLKEIQDVFHMFDSDSDGKLRMAEIKDVCFGVGIALEDDELEKRVHDRKPDLTFTIDDFVAFFVEEVKTGDSKEDVISAFQTITNGESVATAEQVQTALASINKDLATYVVEHLPDGDYVKFTEDLFTR